MGPAGPSGAPGKDRIIGSQNYFAGSKLAESDGKGLSTSDVGFL
jgi:hypothetical protein